jgi:alkylhydroperoxidase family enzyme
VPNLTRSPELGERRTWLFCHAISTAGDCLICSTFFRRLLIDSGEHPEAIQLDELGELIVDLGWRLADDPHSITDALHAKLAKHLTDAQIVTLVAFVARPSAAGSSTTRRSPGWAARAAAGLLTR